MSDFVPAKTQASAPLTGTGVAKASPNNQILGSAVVQNTSSPGQLLLSGKLQKVVLPSQNLQGKLVAGQNYHTRVSIENQATVLQFLEAANRPQSAALTPVQTQQVLQALNDNPALLSRLPNQRLQGQIVDVKGSTVVLQVQGQKVSLNINNAEQRFRKGQTLQLNLSEKQNNLNLNISDERGKSLESNIKPSNTAGPQLLKATLGAQTQHSLNIQAKGGREAISAALPQSVSQSLKLTPATAIDISGTGPQTLKVQWQRQEPIAAKVAITPQVARQLQQAGVIPGLSTDAELSVAGTSAQAKNIAQTRLQQPLGQVTNTGQIAPQGLTAPRASSADFSLEDASAISRAEERAAIRALLTPQIQRDLQVLLRQVQSQSDSPSKLLQQIELALKDKTSLHDPAAKGLAERLVKQLSVATPAGTPQPTAADGKSGDANTVVIKDSELKNPDSKNIDPKNVDLKNAESKASATKSPVAPQGQPQQTAAQAGTKAAGGAFDPSAAVDADNATTSAVAKVAAALQTTASTPAPAGPTGPIDVEQIKLLLGSAPSPTTPSQLTTPPPPTGLVGGLLTLLQASLGARLARQQPAQIDKVLQSLHPILYPGTPPTGQAKPKGAGQALSDLAQLDGKHQLIKSIGKFLSSHQQQKLGSAELQTQGQESLYYTLPLGTGEQRRDIELLIKREPEPEQQSKKSKLKGNYWALTMKLDVGNLGQVLAKARLKAQYLELDFYTPHEATKIQLMEFIPYLKRRLDELGIELGASKAQLGKIPDSLQKRPYHLFQAKA